MLYCFTLFQQNSSFLPRKSHAEGQRTAQTRAELLCVTQAEPAPPPPHAVLSALPSCAHIPGISGFQLEHQVLRWTDNPEAEFCPLLAVDFGGVNPEDCYLAQNSFEEVFEMFLKKSLKTIHYYTWPTLRYANKVETMVSVKCLERGSKHGTTQGGAAFEALCHLPSWGLAGA